jgi:RNA polymerase sigma factor (sigma-70 family)
MREDPSSDPVAIGLGDLRWVHALARRLCDDDATADDLVQDAAALALVHPRAPRGDARSLRTWLRATLPFLARARRRGAARRALHELRAARPEADAPTDELVERTELQQRILAAVLSLSEPNRTTFLMRHVDGLPPRTISARLGVPVVTVYSRLERGLADVRARLEREGGGSLPALLAPLLRVPEPCASAPDPSTAPLFGYASSPLVAALAMKSLALALSAAASLLLVAGMWRSIDSADISQNAALDETHVTLEPNGIIGHDDVAAVQDDSSEQPNVSDAATRTPVRSELVPARAAVLRGRVVRRDGRGVAEAPLRLALGTHRNPRSLELRTDQQGRFLCELPEHSGDVDSRFVRAVVVAPGADHTGARVDIERYVSEEAEESLELAVGDGAELGGVVLDADGRPFPDATVHAWFTDLRAFDLPTRAADRVVRCDGEGRFTLPALGGWFMAAARAEGRVPWTGLLGVWGERPEAAATPFVLVLAQAREVRGRVVDERGRSVEGAEVTLTAHELPPFAAQSPDQMVEPRAAFEATTITASDGSYVFPAAPATRLSLAVVHTSHLPWHGRLEHDAAPEVVTLSRGESVSGVVHDEEGAPVTGATVLAWHTDRSMSRIQTDASGEFRLEGLDATREFLITARAAGHAPTSRRLVTDAIAGGELLVLTLESPAALLGSVVDPTGATVAGATVEIVGGPRTDGSPQCPARLIVELTSDTRATVDLADTFAFEELAPGRYTLSVRSPSAPTRRARVEVDAPRGVTRVVLTLPQEPTEALLAGRVVDRVTGIPLEHFVVDMHRAARGGWSVWNVRAFEELAHEGRFSHPFAWVPGESYRFAVNAPGYTAWRTAPLQLDEREAREGLADLAIALDPAASLTLRVIAAEGSVAPEGGLSLQFARADGEPILASSTGFAPGFVRARIGEPTLIQGLPRAPLRLTLDSVVIEGAWQRWTVDFEPAQADAGVLTVAVDFTQGQRMSR